MYFYFLAHVAPKAKHIRVKRIIINYWKFRFRSGWYTHLDKYDTYTGIAATITIDMLKQSKQNALNYTIYVYKQLSNAKKYIHFMKL